MNPYTLSPRTPSQENSQAAHPPPATFPKREEDYVATFDQVTRVNLLIERRGATPKRLLRRSNLHYAIGDFERSAADAAEILHADPQNSEGYFRIATASLALAVQQLNPAAQGGVRPRKRSYHTPREHLVIAQMALRKTCKLNPNDEEAQEALKTTRWLLASLPELEPGREPN